jgi:hypothetical protein
LAGFSVLCCSPPWCVFWSHVALFACSWGWLVFIVLGGDVFVCLYLDVLSWFFWCISLYTLLFELLINFAIIKKKKNYYITDDRGEQTWVTRPRPALTDMHIDKTVGFNRWSGWKMKKVGLSWIPMVGWGSVKHHPWEPTTGRLKAR